MTTQNLNPNHHESAQRLVIVTRYRLDGDALAALFAAHSDCRILSTTTSLKVAALVCRHRRPDALLMDAELVEAGGYDSLGAFVSDLGDVPVMILDSEPNFARMTTVFELQTVSYFTRRAPFADLVSGIRRLVSGDKVFDPIVQEQICHTPNGWRIRRDHGVSPLAVLTPREVEVLKLIAAGNSVKGCAVILELAPSTVDNHKSRMMKKLGVHKSLELTRLAIREGLIRI